MADNYDDDAYERLAAGQRGARSRSGRRGRRLMTTLVAVAAVLGFGVILVYAYNKGRQDGSSGKAPPLIQAREGPTKVRPEQPGGMKVPDRDKEVFSRLEGDRQAPEKVEKLLPPPEKPMNPPQPPVGATEADRQPPSSAAVETSKLNDTAAAAGTEATQRPMASSSTDGSTVAPPQLPPPPPVAKMPESPASPKVDAPSIVTSEPKIAAAPQAPATGKPPTASARLPKAALADTFRIQLAALRSEDAARKSWAAISKRHSDVLSRLSPYIKRSDLGGKLGVFYRVQAGPFDSRESATAACERLKSRKVSCLVVKP